MSISDIQAIIPVQYIHMSIKNVVPSSPRSESEAGSLHQLQVRVRIASGAEKLLFLSPFTRPPRPVTLRLSVDRPARLAKPNPGRCRLFPFISIIVSRLCALTRGL